MLVSNFKKYGLVLVTLLMIISIQIVTYAQEEETDDILAVSDRTTQVRDAIVAAVPGVTDAANVTETHLAAITILNLRNKSITALNSGDFSGMAGLTNLNLYGNQLSSLPDGIFKGLASLTTLRLGGNTVDPMQIGVSLEEVGTNEYKVSIPTGATFDITVSIVLTDGVNHETLRSVTLAEGSVESASFTAQSVSGETVEIGATLPSLPRNHFGYELVKIDPPRDEQETVTEEQETVTEEQETVTEEETTTGNNAPSFTDGETATRFITEDTFADTNIGTAVGAIDADSDDTLTYTLGGRDAASFAIESTTGQLKTKAVLDFETKSVYVVSITVSDTSDTDTISVVISIIDAADTPISTADLDVSDRTPEVRDAIVAELPHVTYAASVTAAHLRTITVLHLRNEGITTLKTGDFSGLIGLAALNLYGNMLSTLPDGIFNGLISLTSLRLGGNTVSPMPIIVSLQQMSHDQYRVVIPAGAPFDVVVPLRLTDGSLHEDLGSVTVPKGSLLSERKTVPVVAGKFIDIGALPSLPLHHFGYVLSKSATCNVTMQVAEAIAAAVPGVTDCRNVSEAQLAAITSLDLSSDSVTLLQSKDFAGLLSLATLNLESNQLSSLPDGIFEDLTSLTTLQLIGNTGAPFSFDVSLEKVGTNQFKAVMPIGAPFDVVLPFTVTNGTAADSATSITISQGSVESGTLAVTRTLNTLGAVTVDIGTLPSIPTSHNGYALSKLSELPLTIFEVVNVAPVFTESAAATRSIAENTAAATNIGLPVSATDGNSTDTLVYSLSGTEAPSFAIVASTGQLQTRDALDYETKNTYTVIVTVSDSSLSDELTVTINVTDVDENRAPVFTDGTATTRSIAENTAAETNIGTPVEATDADSADTPTYTLGGTDAATFDIVSTTGQLQTKNALNYEQKNSYSVTVTVSDGEGGSDSINVTINITDVLDEDTQQQQVIETTQSGTPTNNAPSFTDGTIALRFIREDTVADTNIGIAIGATDVDADDTLTYTLGGRDAASFAIESTTGQLKTKAALDYETKSVYHVSITVSDDTDTDTISVVIGIIDAADTPIYTADLSVSDRTPEVRDAIVAALPHVTDAASVTAEHLRTITLLPLPNAGLTTLKTGDFSGLIGLTTLDLDGNMLSTLPDGIFNELISLTSLWLGGNTVSPMPIIVSLQQMSHDQYRVVIPAGAPFDVVVPLRLTDGSLHEDLGSVTVPKGSLMSERKTVPVVAGKFIDIGALPSLPPHHFGYTLSKSAICNVTLSVAEAIAAAVPGVSDCRNVSEAQLAAITSLDLSSDSVTLLQSKDFAGLLSLATLNLENNQLSSLPDGIFADLTSLRTLQLTGNTGAPFSFDVSLEKVGTNQFKAVMPIGAPFDVVLPITFTNGSAADSTTSITISQGSVESGTLTVARTLNTFDAVTMDIGTLPSIPTSHNGYALSKSSELPLTIFEAISVAPVLTEGTAATRSIAENTAAATNIGLPVSATDGNSTDTLVYSLSGTDAASFAIVTSTGQLQTRDALDYETKNTYTVIVTVSDSSLSDEITVTINVTDVDENRAPVFTDGTATTRSIAENTAAGTNIGTPVEATDADTSNEIPDVIAYSLGGTDVGSFTLDSTTGQLQTRASLDYETKSSYTVTVTASDDTNSTDITVTINVTDLNEVETQNAPVFTAGTSTSRSIAENTPSGTDIGSAVSATDADVDTTLAYSLSGADASSFGIVDSTGQLQTSGALDYETKDSYSVTITVSDGSLSDTITVTISVTEANDAPVFDEDTTTTRSVGEEVDIGTIVGNPVRASDQDRDVLNYTLSGTDAASFTINSSTGQLKTAVELDFDTQSAYSVVVTATDNNTGTEADRDVPLSDSITVTINVNQFFPGSQAPQFDELSGDPSALITRSVDENTASGTDIGSPVSATDPEADELTYSLPSGSLDNASFSIVSTTGQLQTSAALNHETKDSYSVFISVSDGTNAATTPVTINVIDINDAPVFTDGTSITLTAAENTATDTNIGSPISATDEDEPAKTLTYTLSGTNADVFAVDSIGQIKTKSDLDFETTSAYTVTLTVSDGNLSDTITVTINITNVTENNDPVFTEGDSTTRSIDENSASGTDIGSPVSATDPEADELTYSLPSGSLDNASFSIVSTTGQLQTSAALNHETKDSYSVFISVSDGTNAATTEVTINVNDINDAPVFTDGTSITLTVEENTVADTNIGSAIAATDEDEPANTLTYTLSDTDAAAFAVDSTGQIKTKSDLDFETTSAYTVTLTVSDGNLSDTITVTINITNVTENNDPVFTEGDSTTRSIDESDYTEDPLLATWVDIGDPIAATDDENDTLTYAITGSPTGFQILSTGQLQGKGLDHETAASHSLTITVTDTNSGSDSISVTVTVNDINEKPLMASDSATTIDVISGTAASSNIGAAYTAYDYDDSDTITFSLTGTDANSFTITSSSTTNYAGNEGYSRVATGQITNSAALDSSTQSSYSLNVVATDTAGLTRTTAVTINVVVAPDPAVADRTATVRDAIIAAIDGVSSASEVTSSHLASMTALDLSNQSISSLSTGDFNGMSSLTSLDLSGNSMSGNLPDGIFSGLSLTTLDLSGNTGTSAIVLSFERVADSDDDINTADVRVKVNTAAPFGMQVVVLRRKNILTEELPQQPTISAGSIYSDTFVVERESDGEILFPVSVSIDATNYPALPSGHTGYTFNNSNDQPLEVLPDDEGTGAPALVENTNSQLPVTTALLPNFPNPFNPETWIPYQLNKPSDVSITIYDIRGSVVRELDLGQKTAGYYTDRNRAAHWDGRNNVGEHVANGIYFYKFEADGVSALRKMLIVK